MMISKKAFVSLSVGAIADLPQLPSTRWKRIFSLFSDTGSLKHLSYLNIQKYLKLQDKIINCLSSCLTKFRLVTLVMM